MVMPLMPGMGLIAGPGRPGTVTMPMPMFPGTGAISFDLNYIQREFIPELIDRAFPEQKSTFRF